jgi:membrane protein implicated in regulation of membrane protease activity
VNIEFWHWGVLGFLLLVAEMFLPTGFVLIWIGSSALIVGGLAWLWPALSWQGQLVLFGVLSIVSFFVWKRLRPANLGSDQPTLNRRGHSYVGKLHVDDSQWRITGADAEAGAQVRVVAADGNTLKVERV